MIQAYGQVETVQAGIRRVLARNPSPFTLHGTASFIVGTKGICIIDPGPALPEHIAALHKAIEGETVRAILITHTHLDHSPAARAISDHTGAPILAFRKRGIYAPGADSDFIADRTLCDGEKIAGDGWTLQVIHTPGHTADHLCFAYEQGNVLFCGDHVMGWSSSVIIPPDGDMAAYRASLLRLLDERPDGERFLPTHGPPIEQPHKLIKAMLDHRKDRELQILASLDHGPATIEEIVTRTYKNVRPELRKAACYSALAHLLELIGIGRVACDRDPEVPAARFRTLS